MATNTTAMPKAHSMAQAKAMPMANAMPMAMDTSKVMAMATTPEEKTKVKILTTSTSEFLGGTSA